MQYVRKLLLLVVLLVLFALLITYSISPKAPQTTSPTTYKTKISSPFSQLFPSFKEIDFAKIVVLIDNHPNGSLSAPWGISIYVETPDARILFDTGPDPEDLISNAEALGIDLSSVDMVVISHEHGDHTGGLAVFEKWKSKVRVYIPTGMSSGCKRRIKEIFENVIELNETTEIEPGVIIIGQLCGPPYEQALAINVKKVGLVLIVGCSHPGVVNFVKKAKEDVNSSVYMVIGGFHLAGASDETIKKIVHSLVDLGVKKIIPIHCSGDRIVNFLLREYPEHHERVVVGTSLLIEEKSAP